MDFEGTLDANRNLSLDITAKTLGAIRATVVPLSAPPVDGELYTGRLLVYQSGYSTLVGQAEGRGELTVPNLPRGSYTVVALKYRESRAAAVSTLLSGAAVLYRGESPEMTLKERQQVSDGAYLDFGTLTPSREVGSDLLGDYLLYADARQIAPDGTVDVTVRAEPLTQEPSPVVWVEIRRTTPTVLLTINGSDQGISTTNEEMYTSSGTYYTVSRQSFATGEGVTSLRLTYTDKPREDSELVQSYIRVTSANTAGGSSYSYLALSQSTDRFELEVPPKYLRALVLDADGEVDWEDPTTDPWTMPVVIHASQKDPASGKDPQQITIYDNGTAVGTFPVTQVSTRVTIQLTDPGVWGLHTLSAARPDVSRSDDVPAATDPAYCYVADPEREVNVNHLVWWHRNDQGLQKWRFEKQTDMAGNTFRYYPSKNSAFVFAIRNARADQLENVRLSTTYRGISDYNTYPADNISKEEFLKFWNDRDGYNRNSTLDNTAQLTASENFDDVVDTLPAALRDSLLEDQNANLQTFLLSDGTLSEADAKASLNLPAGDTETELYEASKIAIQGSGAVQDAEILVTLSSVHIDSAHYDTDDDTGKLNTTDTEKLSYVAPDTAEAVNWLMNYERHKKHEGTETEQTRYANVVWSYHETMQGRVYERIEEVFSEGENGLDLTARSTMYLPAAAVEARNPDILDGITVDSGSRMPTPRNTAVVRLETVSVYHTALFDEEAVRSALTAPAGRQLTLDRTDTVPQLQGLGEIVNGVKGSFGVVKTGLQVLGIGKTVIEIAKGRQGKSPDTLTNGMTQVSGTARMELERDVREYGALRNELYARETAWNTVKIAASVKGAGMVATAADSLIVQGGRKEARDDLNAIYNAIETRIANQVQIQEMNQAIRDGVNEKYDKAIESLRQRLTREGFSGESLIEEMGKFGMCKSASGEYACVPLDGWGPVENGLTGYCPEQPEMGKFEIDWGPSFGGRVPTPEELAAFQEDPIWGEEIPTDWDTLLDIEFDPAFELEEVLPSFDLYIDPAGYVFEAVEENRVEGTPATLYQGNGTTAEETSSYAVWQDPSETDPQENPQLTSGEIPITTEDGTPILNPLTGEAYTEAEGVDAKDRYGWMTPAGVWKVRFTDERDSSAEYQIAESKPMTVPPAHTEVNIGLLSTKAPAVESQTIQTNRITVVFDKWMQRESIVDAVQGGETDGWDSQYSAITVTDADGNLIPGTISFPDQRDNTGYKDGTYQQDVIGSDFFVRTAVSTPDALLTEGDTYAVRVSGAVLSYAGVSMGTDASLSGTADRPALATYTVTLNPNGGTVSVSSVVTAPGGALTAALPRPSRSGFSCQGWFTASTGGTRVTDNTGTVVSGFAGFSQDTVLYAQWRSTGGGGGGGGSSSQPVQPSVTVNDSSAGTVSVTASTAAITPQGRLPDCQRHRQRNRRQRPGERDFDRTELHRPGECGV